MSNDKMQDEFEAAIAVEAGQSLTAIQLSRKGDSYSTSPLIYAWWAWQASRESLVIELPEINPEMFSCNVVFGHEKARNEATKAIEAAGVKVKP